MPVASPALREIRHGGNNDVIDVKQGPFAPARIRRRPGLQPSWLHMYTSGEYLWIGSSESSRTWSRQLRHFWISTHVMDPWAVLARRAPPFLDDLAGGEKLGQRDQTGLGVAVVAEHVADEDAFVEINPAKVAAAERDHLGWTNEHLLREHQRRVCPRATVGTEDLELERLFRHHVTKSGQGEALANGNDADDSAMNTRLRRGSRGWLAPCSCTPRRCSRPACPRRCTHLCRGGSRREEAAMSSERDMGSIYDAIQASVSICCTYPRKEIGLDFAVFPLQSFCRTCGVVTR